MLRKNCISFILMCCISLSAFAIGAPQNTSSKWKKIASGVSANYKKSHGSSHAKKPSKIPFVVTSLEWNGVVSAYRDTIENHVITWNEDSTAPVQMVIYHFDGGVAEEKVVVDSFKMISGGEAFNDFDFLGDWLPAQATIYVKSGSAWVLAERITITTTSRGIENILYEEWTGSAWENSILEYYLFDTHDMPLGYLVQEWDTNDWVSVDGGRIDYTYDGNDLPVQADHSIMKDGGSDWEPVEYGIFKEVYTRDIYEEIGAAKAYFTNGTDETVDSFANIVWHDFQEGVSGFLSTGGSQYTSYTVHRWNDAGSTWDPYQSYAKTYNSSDLETEEIMQTWDDNTSQWINNSRTTWDYYADGELKEVLYYSWSGSAWNQTTGERWNNTYDTDNDITEQTVDYYSGTAWVKNYKTIYSFTMPVGIKEPKNLPQVKFYPNPAASEIMVELPGNNGTNGSLKIFTLNGQLVSVMPVNAAGQTIKVDVTKLTSGTYILSIESGDAVRTSRFVKQ